jgi:hypothetical protein
MKATGSQRPSVDPRDLEIARAFARAFAAHCHPSAFEVRLFGRYARPIRDFNYGYQHDLAAAYRTSSKVADLPFPFGYHWQDGRSGLILARTAAKRS